MDIEIEKKLEKAMAIADASDSLRRIASTLEDILRLVKEDQERMKKLNEN